MTSELVDEKNNPLSWEDLKSQYDDLRGKEVGFIVYVKNRHKVSIEKNKLLVTGTFSLQPLI